MADDASIATDDAAIDAFPPKQPVPKSKTDIDLSKLGPGQAEEASPTTDQAEKMITPPTDGAEDDSPPLDELEERLPPMDEATRRAEENRKAKMRALMWAEGGSDDDAEMFDGY